MAPTCYLLGTIETTEAASREAQLPPEVDWIGLRADLIGDVAARSCADRSSRRVLYQLGPDGPGSANRHSRLTAAAAWADLVELDYHRDLVDPITAAIPPESRWITWRGPARRATASSVTAGLASAPAAVRCIEADAEDPGEALEVLALLRHPLVAGARGAWVIHARGPSATWTRILAPWIGSCFAIGRVDPAASGSADGTQDVERLRSDYDLPNVGPIAHLYGIVGPGALGSSAPGLHNAGYRRAGLPALYLPFVTNSTLLDWVTPFASRLQERIGLSLGGLTVTAPHKEEAVRLAGRGGSSPAAWATQAANNLSFQNDAWRADTDGAESVLIPLLDRGVEPAGRRAAVVGCGGAGRIAALGLAAHGASVTLVNRSQGRGQWAASRLSLPFIPLDLFDPDRFDLLIHATPVGKAESSALVGPEKLARGAVVLDMVYRHDGPTDLVRRARASGRLAIDGHEVLATSVARQYAMLTGERMTPGPVTVPPALPGASRA